MVRREAKSKVWRCIQTAVGKQRQNSVIKVQKKEGEIVIDYETKEDIETALA
jgi:hypothetical protein